VLLGGPEKAQGRQTELFMGFDPQVIIDSLFDWTSLSCEGQRACLQDLFVFNLPPPRVTRTSSSTRPPPPHMTWPPLLRPRSPPNHLLQLRRRGRRHPPPPPENFYSQRRSSPLPPQVTLTVTSIIGAPVTTRTVPTLRCHLSSPRPPPLRRRAVDFPCLIVSPILLLSS
jgi:hypothetical protein